MGGQVMVESVPISIDVYSDVVCPWCYLGKLRLGRAVAAMRDTPVAVRWRPFQLDSTIPEGGMARSDYVRRKFGSPEALKDSHRTLMLLGAEEGATFDFDRITRSPNTLPAHELIALARRNNLEDEMVERLFRAYFADGADAGALDVLVEAAQAVGLDPASVRASLETRALRPAVEREIAAAVRLGVTGVPTFVIANRYAVVGAQDPRYIAGAIGRARADAAAEGSPT